MHIFIFKSNSKDWTIAPLTLYNVVVKYIQACY